MLLLAEMLLMLASLSSQEQTGAAADLVSYVIGRRLKVRQQSNRKVPVQLSQMPHLSSMAPSENASERPSV